jgi:hypothetical protein
MNERIRELANQADQYANQQNELYGVDFKTEYDQKFAELIIRKCAKVADLADENKCEWIGGNILNHFGVEE